MTRKPDPRAPRRGAGPDRAIAVLLLLAAALACLVLSLSLRGVSDLAGPVRMGGQGPVDPGSVQDGDTSLLLWLDALVLAVAFAGACVRSRGFRRAALRVGLPLAILVALFLFLHYLAPGSGEAAPELEGGVAPQPTEEALHVAPPPTRGPAGIPPRMDVPEVEGSFPSWIVPAAAAAGGLLVAGASALSIAAAVRKRKRLRAVTAPVEAIRELAEEARRSLSWEGGRGPGKEAVITAYTRFLEAAREATGHARGEAETAREFERGLARLGVGGESFSALTRLFEAARYSRAEEGDSGAAEASRLFGEVAAACARHAEAAKAEREARASERSRRAEATR